MRKSAAIIALFLLAGCESCEKKFFDGEVVTHALWANRYVIIESAKRENMDGVCLVTVRDEKEGRVMSLSPNELRSLP